MAINVISRIQVRSGLSEDLPQLAKGELGWSVDTQQLWIGNGTYDDGAPNLGNTLILTTPGASLTSSEDPDDPDNPSVGPDPATPVSAADSFPYTFRGSESGYIAVTGPSGGDVVLSLQSILDNNYISVKSFGAKGDGTTNDTEAINRAFNQIYCVTLNVQVRRVLYFPAGVYIVSGDMLKIPPFASMVGCGMNSSIIRQIDGTQPYVAKFTDSRQQSGSNYTNNAAIPAQYISVTDIGFEHAAGKNVIYAESATRVRFSKTKFQGSLNTPEIDINKLSNFLVAVTVAKNPNSVIPGDWVFDYCSFSKIDFGYMANEDSKNVVFSYCKFSELLAGIVLGLPSATPPAVGPYQYKILYSDFDQIAGRALQVEIGRQILSQGNVYRNVGNNQYGPDNPVLENIKFYSQGSMSINDTFDRTIDRADQVPWIEYGPEIGLNVDFSSFSNLVKSTGFSKILYANTVVPKTLGINIPKIAKGFEFVYTISRVIGGIDHSRKGRLTAVDTKCADEYTETAALGVKFSVRNTPSLKGYVITYTMNNNSPTTDAILSGYFQYNIVAELPPYDFTLTPPTGIWVIPKQKITTTTTTTTTTTATPASYDVSAQTTTLSKGLKAQFVVETTNVPDNTDLYWTIDYNSSSVAADFVTNSGTFKITANQGTFDIPIYKNTTLTGPKTFRAQVRTGSVSGSLQTESGIITITDIIKIPDLAGTLNNPPDAIGVAPSTLVVSAAATISGVEANSNFGLEAPAGYQFSLNGTTGWASFITGLTSDGTSVTAPFYMRMTSSATSGASVTFASFALIYYYPGGAGLLSSAYAPTWSVTTT